jgi:hypothetical protein
MSYANEGNAEWVALASMERRGRSSAALFALQNAIEGLLATCTDTSVEGCWIDLVGADEPLWVDAAVARGAGADAAAAPRQDMDAMARVAIAGRLTRSARAPIIRRACSSAVRAGDQGLPTLCARYVRSSLPSSLTAPSPSSAR